MENLTPKTSSDYIAPTPPEGIIPVMTPWEEDPTLVPPEWPVVRDMSIEPEVSSVEG